MQKIEIETANKKSSKLAWVITAFFLFIFAGSFYTGMTIHESEVIRSDMQANR